MNERSLDTLLATAREPGPFDEAFVESVMQKVASHPKPAMSSLRRPVVAGLAAATLLGGGTVAAMVASTPSPDALPRGRASVEVIIPAETDAPRAHGPSATHSEPEAPEDVEAHDGPGSHSTSVIDPSTGLELAIDSITDTIEAGRPHRVEISLRNTGSEPVTVRGPRDDCLLHVMVFPLEGAHSEESVDGGCAAPGAGQFELAPGARLVEHVDLILPAGEWGLVGMCDCSAGLPRSSDAMGELPSGAGLLVPHTIEVEVAVRDVGMATSPLRVTAV